MTNYNAWMNVALYDVCESLTEEERRQTFAVYFESVHGTLNHLLYADRMWLGRLTGEPYTATTYGQEIYSGFAELRRERIKTDEAIAHWVDSLTEERLAETFTFRSAVDGITRTNPMGVIVLHFFNHQTHHRGQLSALIALLGKEPMVTDILWMPDELRLAS